MTITYQAYSPEEGPYLGVIPKEYVAALGGETYKYASSGGKPRSKTLRRRTSVLRKKTSKTKNPTRARKSRKSFR